MGIIVSSFANPVVYAKCADEDSAFSNAVRPVHWEKAGKIKPLSYGITRAAYNMIRNGMTLSEVEAITGYYGEEVSRMGNSAMYMWTNEDGSSITCVFIDGRVAMKSQVLLR
jgi:hypothetical protein